MYAVIYIPNFYLQAALRHDPPGIEQPAGLLDSALRPSENTTTSKQAKSPLIQATPDALSAGVELGMTANQGRARCHNLKIISRSLTLEQSATQALLQFGETISPNIESTQAGVCTIDLRGTRHKTKAAQFFHEAWGIPLRRLGLHSQIGLAATPELARLAAKQATSVLVVPPTRAATFTFMEPMAIEATELEHETKTILHRWGIQTLGDLVQLPKEHVIERLGQSVLKLWTQLSHLTPRPLKLCKADPVVDEAMDFEPGIERLEALIFHINRFLQQIALRLETLYLVAGHLNLQLRFEDGSTHERLFQVPDPTRDSTILLRMLHTYLESFRSDSAVTGLAIRVEPARASERQLSLFESDLKDPNRFAETLARLEALLGENHVGSPEVISRHKPDGVRMKPFVIEHSSKEDSKSPPSTQTGPAFRHFRPPVQVNVNIEESQTGKSPSACLYLHDSRTSERCQQFQGPWYRSGNWWDENRWSREEWDIEMPNGSIYRLVKTKGRWQLDGIYD